MRDRPISAAHDYWRILCAGRPAPDRMEIDPARLAAIGALSTTAMIEVPSLLVRVAGSEIEEWMPRGETLDAVFPDDAVGLAVVNGALARGKTASMVAKARNGPTVMVLALPFILTGNPGFPRAMLVVETETSNDVPAVRRFGRAGLRVIEGGASSQRERRT